MLSPFRREHTNLRSFVLSQDIVYIGGGNTANLLALWRLDGLDEILAEALSSGVVLAGLSASMNCWFQDETVPTCGAAARRGPDPTLTPPKSHRKPPSPQGS